MKQFIIPAILSIFTFAIISCGDAANTTNNTEKASAEGTQKKGEASTQAMAMPQANQQLFIPVDSADVMIGSYLTSINYMQEDTDLHSLIVNADSLRAYLANPLITHVKLMFAHTLDYINNGGKDQPAGYKSGALTLVIAGFDKDGNYLFYVPYAGAGNMVLNHSLPCPNYCPIDGTASSNFLTH